MLELYLVRHGESTRNHATLLAHQGDFAPLQLQLDEDAYEPGWPLTELGLSQAVATGHWLGQVATQGFDLAFVSPYNRTLQTSKALGLGIKFREDWRLRERHWGDYHSQPKPYSAQAYLEDLTHCGNPTWKSEFPGGESIEDLVPNVSMFLAERLHPLENKRILIVSHGGTIKAMCWVLDGRYEGPTVTAVPNASVVVYRIEEFFEDGRAAGTVSHADPWHAPKEPLVWQQIDLSNASV